MKYYVIGEEDTVLGFGMAGVKGSKVENSDQALAAFDDALSDKDIGIIIINERTADMIRERVNKYIFSQNFPLIIEIPDRTGRDSSRPGLRTMVNEAIGINL